MSVGPRNGKAPSQPAPAACTVGGDELYRKKRIIPLEARKTKAGVRGGVVKHEKVGASNG